MPHHRPRAAALLALLAVLVLAPGAAAAAPSKGAAAVKAKERAYGKHCGAKHKGSGRWAQRAKCLEAMAKLATGRSSSPPKACAGLTRKKATGERRSAFARCVSAGAKLLKSQGAADRDDATGDDDHGDEPDDDDGDDGDDDDGDDDDGGDDLDLGLDLPLGD